MKSKKWKINSYFIKKIYREIGVSYAIIKLDSLPLISPYAEGEKKIWDI